MLQWAIAFSFFLSFVFFFFFFFFYLLGLLHQGFFNFFVIKFIMNVL